MANSWLYIQPYHDSFHWVNCASQEGKFLWGLVPSWRCGTHKVYSESKEDSTCGEAWIDVSTPTRFAPSTGHNPVKLTKARTLWVHTLLVENDVLPCFFSLSNGLVAGRNISISSGTFLMILKADSTACKQITRNIELLGASFYNACPVFHASCSSLHAALLIKIQHSYNIIKA